MEIQADKIKGVIFDVDGTLFYHFPVRIIALTILIINSVFAPIYLLRVIKILRFYRSAQESLRRTSGSNRFLSDVQLQMTANASGEPPDFVQETVNEWMMRRPLSFLKYFLRPGLLKFLKRMETRSIKLGVYSDYPCVDKLKQMNISHFFSSVVSSFDPDVNKLKPDPKGFLICSERLGLLPEDILFIGDREKVDAVGAERCGMQAILVGNIFKKKTISRTFLRYRSFNDICRELFAL